MIAIDLFCGCGGTTDGLKKAGFNVVLAIDNCISAVNAYIMNHNTTKVICEDIRKISHSDIIDNIGNTTIHLLSGCPPCQGFSSIRRLNKKKNVKDDRNNLLNEYLRIINSLRPLTIMFENVPAVKNYSLFKQMIFSLKGMGYFLDYNVINMKDYGIPQRRKRLFVIGSLLGNINIANSFEAPMTVRNAISHLSGPSKSKDHIHRIIPKHTKRISKMISLIPKDGGSRKDLRRNYILDCHKKENVGFNDVYGRLKWDDFSTTITGGCLNPSKGRFLHPSYNRCISAREAALLQSFPENYKFPQDISKTELALMIGNALPPKFAFIQAEHIARHINALKL
ncbi:MAG: DNA cytosine methyltransferase [Endomicrobiaceae bacterium]